MSIMASKGYEEYLNAVKLTPMSRFNLPTPMHEETLSELVVAGYKILEAEAKAKGGIPPVPTKPVPPKDDMKRLESQMASTSDNPYIKARIQILNKMTPIARGIIEKMEKGELPKDSRYDSFAQAVANLGDKFSV